MLRTRSALHAVALALVSTTLGAGLLASVSTGAHAPQPSSASFGASPAEPPRARGDSPANAPTAPVESDALVRARARTAEKDWQGAVDVLCEFLKRSSGDGAEQELLGTALLQLGRADESAFHLDAAWRRHRVQGREDRAKSVAMLLARADPLTQRRNSFLSKLVDQLCDSAEELNAAGHPARALAILERLPAAAAPGKEAQRVESLLTAARAAFETMHLDDPEAGPASAAGPLPVFEHESAHYRFACRLEPAIVERMGTLMDDLHAFYVQVYFDGDARKAAAPKPLVRVHATKADMLKDWGGGSAPEGWWSPGSNEVITYDTRSAARPGEAPSLDPMMTTLFHEASHQFMSLLSRGGFTPAWLNEGTASFFEGTVAMADGRVLWPDVAVDRLRNLVSALGSGSPTARATVSYDSPGSYGAEYYAFGWGLCWFLQQYEDPVTLEYVYRPLYAEYRSKVIAKGGDPMKVFEEVFLGPKSPRKHATFDDFERDWKAWILNEVRPAYDVAPETRALRMKRVNDYLMAAERAKNETKPRVSEPEFLRRALSNVEWIRSKLDKASKPDGEILILQIDLLERLSRSNAAAPLIEQVLDMADAKTFDLDEKRYAELSKRLARIDRRNAALRTARSRTANLARAAANLLADYRARPDSVLRAYTFASVAAGALQDDALGAAAGDLRALARERGLLQGSIHALGARVDRWECLQKSPPEVLRADGASTVLESVRATTCVDLDVPVTGEYEIRARLVRTRAADPGSCIGLVVAGAAEGDWTMVGFDELGYAGLWISRRADRGGSTLKRVQMVPSKVPIDVRAPLDVAVRVGRDGAIDLKVGGASAFTARLPLDPSVPRHVGVFAKYASVRFEDAVVEIYP